MLLKRTLTHILLTLALLVGQQAAFAHAATHLPGKLPTQDKQLPHSKACDQCVQGAQLGAALLDTAPASFGEDDSPSGRDGTGGCWVANESGNEWSSVFDTFIEDERPNPAIRPSTPMMAASKKTEARGFSSAMFSELNTFSRDLKYQSSTCPIASIDVHSAIHAPRR